MTVYRRGKWYWMDAVVLDRRHRESLHTTDWREARQLEKQRIAELAKASPESKQGNDWNLCKPPLFPGNNLEMRIQMAAVYQPIPVLYEAMAVIHTRDTMMSIDHHFFTEVLYSLMIFPPLHAY